MSSLSGVRVEVPEIPFVESVELPASSTALVVVDMQNDFVKPGGRLRVPSAESIVAPIAGLLREARRSGVMVVYTMDTHYEGDPEFEVWGVHALRGTWGWRIIDELAPSSSDVVIEKTRYDGFYGTPLDDILRSYGVRNVVVVGVVANICVLHTAASAAMRHYKVYIPMDAVAALNAFDYYAALRQVAFLYRGVLVRRASAVKFIGEGRWRRG